MSKMTPEERVDLIQHLQDDVENFVAERSRHSRDKVEQEDNQNVDEIMENLETHPAFMKEIDWSKPLSAEMEALMALKYESENPVAQAESYREEGNDLFKKKKYRLAIENYTEGIKANSSDRNQNAVLYTNRAAAQFRRGNNRSALNDCIIARKFKPDHMKAIVKGALCCAEMNKHADTMQWCSAGLLVERNHKELSELKIKARSAKIIQDRDERKRARMEEKEEAATLKLIEVIKSRHIQLSTIPKSEKTARITPSLLYDLDPVHPEGSRVLLENDVLHWPVLFLYPEYSQSDIVQRFSENATFNDLLANICGRDMEPAPWDTERKYTVDRLQLYFEDKGEETLHPVSRCNTLLEALQHKKYQVYQGTPEFIAVVKDSDFHGKFLKQRKVVR